MTIMYNSQDTLCCIMAGVLLKAMMRNAADLSDDNCRKMLTEIQKAVSYKRIFSPFYFFLCVSFSIFS